MKGGIRNWASMAMPPEATQTQEKEDDGPFSEQAPAQQEGTCNKGGDFLCKVQTVTNLLESRKVFEYTCIICM